MHARLTATTGQIGSLAVCSLAQDLGSTGFTAAVAIGVADGNEDALDAALTGADVDSRHEAVLIADADLRAAAGLPVAGPLGTDRLAVEPAVIIAVVSTAEGAVPSMAGAAVASTVVAEAMAAATGN
jgi:hypothetical protein